MYDSILISIEEANMLLQSTLIIEDPLIESKINQNRICEYMTRLLLKIISNIQKGNMKMTAQEFSSGPKLIDGNTLNCISSQKQKC